jgi:hypothetical protein
MPQRGWIDTCLRSQGKGFERLDGIATVVCNTSEASPCLNGKFFSGTQSARLETTANAPRSGSHTL